MGYQTVAAASGEPIRRIIVAHSRGEIIQSRHVLCPAHNGGWRSAHGRVQFAQGLSHPLVSVQSVTLPQPTIPSQALSDSGWWLSALSKLEIASLNMPRCCSTRPRWRYAGPELGSSATTRRNRFSAALTWPALTGGPQPVARVKRIRRGHRGRMLEAREGIVAFSLYKLYLAEPRLGLGIVG